MSPQKLFLYSILILIITILSFIKLLLNSFFIAIAEINIHALLLILLCFGAFN